MHRSVLELIYHFFPIGGSDKTELLAAAPLLDYLRIKSGDTIVHSFPLLNQHAEQVELENPTRAQSRAAGDCEEEGATFAAGRQEVENLCKKLSPGKREAWGEGVL